MLQIIMNLAVAAAAMAGTATAGTAGAEPATCPHQARAVFDVGSGSTKLAVFEIEACAGGNRLARILSDDQSVDVPLEAAKDAAGAISKAGIGRLITALGRLKAKAIAVAKQNSFKEIEFAAAGTHALRTAANQSDVIARVAKLGIPLIALNQRQEALLAFEGAKAKGADHLCAANGRPLLVWDVGGGSMQWTLERTGHPPYVEGLPLGAETFKRKLLKDLPPRPKPECEVGGATPNPIGHAGMRTAVNLAAQQARTLPKRIFELAKGTPCLVGIGGVHNQAIERQIAKQWKQISSCVCGPKKTCGHQPRTYSRHELECLAQILTEKSDCDEEIRGPYSTTSVSNLLLIDGFMHELKLETIHTESADAAHGLAVDHELLRFQKLKLGAG